MEKITRKNNIVIEMLQKPLESFQSQWKDTKKTRIIWKYGERVRAGLIPFHTEVQPCALVNVVINFLIHQRCGNSSVTVRILDSQEKLCFKELANTFYVSVARQQFANTPHTNL
jgi:hypothetical protein